MYDGLRTVDDLDVEGRRVLLRADFDVPLTRGSAGAPVSVADDGRIRGALTTIEELRRRGARLVLVSHVGRPAGWDSALSLGPVAERLAGLTGAPVVLAAGVVGAEVRRLSEHVLPGGMLMVQNVRFEAGETRNDPLLGLALAELAEVHVDDAFAIAHEPSASACAVAEVLPAAAGRLMQREISALSAIVEDPARPLVALVGGARLGETMGAIVRLLERADAVCLGGAIAFPFLAALGHRVGRSLCSPADVEAARAVLETAGESRGRLLVPEDLLLGRWSPGGAGETRVVDVPEVADGWMGLDIGPRTARGYADRIAAAATVFWRGPVGRFELPAFAAGTRMIAHAVASTSGASVVAGSETAAALRRFGLQDRVGHLSSGGPATLAFIEGRELPALRVLSRADRSSPGVIAALNGRPARDSQSAAPRRLRA